MPKATSQYRSLITAAGVAGLGPLLVSGTGFLLRLNAGGIADHYFALFKNAGFLLPVMVGLLLSAAGALPGIIILTETFQVQRRIAAGITILWAVFCLVLSVGLSDFA